jgi:hypothetical protein
VENPKLVVTVITTGRGEAGTKAANIAGRVYRSISYRFLREPGVTTTVKNSSDEEKSKAPTIINPQEQH